VLSERARRALNRGTTSGVIGLAVAGFAMSYQALHSLAVEQGVPAPLAWMWPLVVDGFIVVASLSVRGAAMTARFVYWMNVSLDLFIERADGEQGAGDWLRIYEQLHREFNERAGRLSTLVQGRVIYDMMDPFWPDARADESLPDYLREYGGIWTDKPKVLVSRTRRTASHNTTILGGSDAVDRLAELRRTSDGDIGVGGATLATALLRAHLLDELLLVVHPVVLGAGRPLFDGLDEPLQVDLLEEKSFASGVTMRRYAARGAEGS
jgi:dihydrofolate reductase